MNHVLRGVAIYVFLLLIFRIVGKRNLAESTTFDLVLLLIIGEVTQQALIGEDFSLTAAMVLTLTIIGIDLIFNEIKNHFPFFGKIAEGTALIVVNEGKPLKKRMMLCKVSEEDVLEAARLNFGIGKMAEIKYAIVEKDGGISIVPFSKRKQPE